jgi:hypothetical protein
MCLLYISLDSIARKREYVCPFFSSLCSGSMLPKQCYEAPNANCESFAFTLISSFYKVPLVLSTLLLFALSKPYSPSRYTNLMY